MALPYYRVCVKENTFPPTLPPFLIFFVLFLSAFDLLLSGGRTMSSRSLPVSLSDESRSAGHAPRSQRPTSDAKAKYRSGRGERESGVPLNAYRMDDAPRPGAPEKLTERDERYLQHILTRNSRATLREIAGESRLDISASGRRHPATTQPLCASLPTKALDQQGHKR